MSELTIIKKSVCDRMSTDLEDLVSQVENYSDTVSGKINDIASQLMNNIKPLDPYAERVLVNQAILDINQNMSKIVPSVVDFNEILDIIDQSSYLHISPFLSDPITLTMQILDYLKSRAMGVLFTITDLAEMTISKVMQDYIDMVPEIESVGLQSYSLIHSLNGMCGVTDIENSYARMHNSFHNLCLHPGAIFDINLWYIKGGLDISNPTDALHIENMNMSISVMNNVYRSIESNTNQAVENFKNSLPL